MKKEILRVRGGVKYRSDAVLLKDIGFHVDEGVGYGLMFDNVKEETCMVDILKGNSRFDEGNIYIKGCRQQIQNADLFIGKHIFFLELDNNSAAELEVEDAFFILREKEKKFIKNKRNIRNKIQTIFEMFEIRMPVDAKLSALTQLEQIQLELIKAWYQGFEIIVLHNLAFLCNIADLEKVMQLVAMLKTRGVAFLIIDHDEQMLIRYTNEIIIFRKGRTAYPLSKERFSKDNIAQILMGNVPEHDAHAYQEMNNGKTVLRLEQIQVDNMEPLSCTLEAGEIVVLLDQEGYHGEKIAKLLNGEKVPDAGKIYLNDEEYLPTPEEGAIKKGISVIEENPTAIDGQLFHNLSVLDNLVLTLAGKNKRQIVSKRQQQSMIKESQEFFTKAQMMKKTAQLGSVEKQKLVYYKWYLYYPHVIVCVKPFAGIDYKMQQVTKEFIRKYQERGIGVIIVTQNISEAYSFGGKVIILNDQYVRNPPL